MLCCERVTSILRHGFTLLTLFTDDVHKDREEYRYLLDISSFPQDHLLYSTENAKVIGKMKDAFSCKPLWKFGELLSEMYSFKKYDEVLPERTANVKSDLSPRTFISKCICECCSVFARTGCKESNVLKWRCALTTMKGRVQFGFC
jgi:hypothetical protein